jgi:hypothetical protein
MNHYDEEENFEFINRLLERLHQADYINHGSKIEIVYVASGGQHVETQYISLTPNPSPKGEGNLKGRGVDTFKGERNLPEPLASEEAMALWEKVQKTGYVDDTFQPTISRTQAAILADEIAERLEIKEKWKAFETLWNRRNMYRDYHDALNQRQSLQFRDKLRELFR